MDFNHRLIFINGSSSAIIVNKRARGPTGRDEWLNNQQKHNTPTRSQMSSEKCSQEQILNCHTMETTKRQGDCEVQRRKCEKIFVFPSPTLSFFLLFSFFSLLQGYAFGVCRWREETMSERQKETTTTFHVLFKHSSFVSVIFRHIHIRISCSDLFHSLLAASPRSICISLN